MKCQIKMLRVSEIRRAKEKSSHNKICFRFSIVVFFPLSMTVTLLMYVCVCLLCMFVCVSRVEEQKVSAGLACVGGLRDSP